MLQALESMKFFIDLCRCAQLRPTVCSPMVEACQARLSMEFSRQEYWSRLLVPASGDLPNPGTKPLSPASPALQADSLPPALPGKPLLVYRPAFSEPRKRTPDLETGLSFLICEYIYLFKCVCLKIWRRQWHPTPVLLPGKSHGWRSLAGYIQSMGSQRVGHD